MITKVVVLFRSKKIKGKGFTYTAQSKISLKGNDDITTNKWNMQNQVTGIQRQG